MKWQKLDTLKKMLQDKDDFHGVWQYFSEHFAENDAFIQAGKIAPAKIKELLEPVVKDIALRVLGRSVTVSVMIVNEIVGHHFYHGFVMTDGGVCLALYFHDIHLGLMSFMLEEDSTEMTYGLFDTLADEFINKNAPILPMSNQTGH